MDEVDLLRQEVENLSARVAALEHQVEQLLGSINMNAEGVSNSVMIGSAGNDIVIGTSNQPEPVLKPKEWELLRVLVEADIKGLIAESTIFCSSSQQGYIFRPNNIDNAVYQKIKNEFDSTIGSALQDMLAEGLLQQNGNIDYRITGRAREAVKRHFSS
jgi:hypothetical protein